MKHYTAEDIGRLRAAGIIGDLQCKAEKTSSAGGIGWTSSMARAYCLVTAPIGGQMLSARFNPSHIGADSDMYEEVTGEALPEHIPSEDQVINTALAASLCLKAPGLPNHVQLAILATLQRA